jgi:fumarylacetoacetase-like protein
MKLGTVSVDGKQRVVVAVDSDHVVVLYPGLTVPSLIEDWATSRAVVERAVTDGASAAVSYISGYQTLEPGDIIAMGTALKASAAGGAAVQNVNLTEVGGRIEVTISGIGTLSNPVEER